MQLRRSFDAGGDLQILQVQEGTPRAWASISVLHGYGRYGGGSLVRHMTYAEFVKSLHPKDRAHFPSFLNLEQDKGTQVLAETIARRVVEQSRGQFGVRILSPLVHRGILDMNRTEASVGIAPAIRPILDPERDHTNLLSHLTEMHGHILEALFRWVKDSLLHLDLHTMNPHNPSVPIGGKSQSVALAPGQMDEYIFSYLHPASIGAELRPHDILSKTQGGEPITYEPLSQDLEDELVQLWHAARDKPYQLPVFPHAQAFTGTHFYTKVMRSPQGEGVTAMTDLNVASFVEGPVRSSWNYQGKAYPLIKERDLSQRLIQETGAPMGQVLSRHLVQLEGMC